MSDATEMERDGVPRPTDAGPGLFARIDRADLGRVLVVVVCAIGTGAGLVWPWPHLPVVAVAGLVVGCWPIVAEAIEDARDRQMSMEISMLVAVLAAAAIGEWVTALVIVAFVLAAEILEDLSMERGSDALTDLMAFLPESVCVRDGAAVVDLPLSEVRRGQIVLVPPGGRVPVDGRVASGRSSVDQSRITGEPLPVDVEAGDLVYAGSINQLGAVEIVAEHIGEASSYGRIIAAVKNAQGSEPPVQRLADRLAAWLVFLALAGAVVTYAFTRDVTAAIAVVVVAGSCGIAAGTPLAVLAAIARIARSGGFVKDGAHLEALSGIDTVLFDKTGTLTAGSPAVVAVQAVDGILPEKVVALAAAAEARSEHPLGRAIVSYAMAAGVPVGPSDGFSYEPGRGVRAVVARIVVTVGSAAFVPGASEADGAEPSATAVHVAADGSYLGAILLADTLRPEAASSVAALARLGVRIMMITGDQPGSASAVAAALGIESVRAGLLPEEKLEAIDRERALGRRVAMVGDGVNDAPALARADVGIAMGNGTQIAQESADVVLISSDLTDLVQIISVARRARAIVRANFVGTIAVDLVGILLASIGVLGPMAAALVHVGSETAFILNSARLIPRRRARENLTGAAAHSIERA